MLSCQRFARGRPQRATMQLSTCQEERSSCRKGRLAVARAMKRTEAAVRQKVKIVGIASALTPARSSVRRRPSESLPTDCSRTAFVPRASTPRPQRPRQTGRGSWRQRTRAGRLQGNGALSFRPVLFEQPGAPDAAAGCVSAALPPSHPSSPAHPLRSPEGEGERDVRRRWSRWRLSRQT